MGIERASREAPLRCSRMVGKQEVSVPSCLTVIHNAPILDRLDLADFHTDRFKGGTGVVAGQNWRQPVIDKQVIHVPDLKTIGPYSQAVRAAGLLFVSGQPGVDPATGEYIQRHHSGAVGWRRSAVRPETPYRR